MKQYSEEELRGSYHAAEAFVKESPAAAATYLRNTLSDNVNLRYFAKSVEEKRRNNGEWWATYRAALTGIYARQEAVASPHATATKAADIAHGPLQEITPYKESL